MIENLPKLFEVYNFAKQAHQGQYRYSGEPFITHPIAVSYILIDYKADIQTICASLIHDVVEDTPITLEEITNRFGEEIAFLVDGVTKLETKKQTLEKIKEYSAKDKRVLLIKLADRIHNLQNIPLKMKDVFLRYEKENPFYINLAKQYGFDNLALKLEELNKKFK